jgi:CheY-like chemotaxis protein
LPRVLIVQFNPAESSTLAARVEREGFTPEPYVQRGTKGFRYLKTAPPDAILIDLTSMPFYGRWMGSQFRSSKPLRSIPLVFLEGDPEKTAVARRQFPDATFTSWNKIAAQLRKAIANPLSQPVSPDIYDSPLVTKLRIRQGTAVALLNAPEDFSIGTLPEKVRIVRRLGDTSVILNFVRSAAILSRDFPKLAAAVEPGRTLWICWPKRSSKQSTDLTMPRIREMCQPYNLTDTKVVSLNAKWSAMALSRRRVAKL